MKRKSKESISFLFPPIKPRSWPSLAGLVDPPTGHSIKEPFWFKTLISLSSSKNNELTFSTLDCGILNKIDLLKIDTEGYEFEVLKGLDSSISKVYIILFEHHYDDMIIKNYTFQNIHKFLVNNGFKKVYKSKMPFRKSFNYIYIKNNVKTN